MVAGPQLGYFYPEFFMEIDLEGGRCSWSDEVYRDVNGVLGTPGAYHVTSSMSCAQYSSLINAGGYQGRVNYRPRSRTPRSCQPRWWASSWRSVRSTCARSSSGSCPKSRSSVSW